MCWEVNAAQLFFRLKRPEVNHSPTKKPMQCIGFFVGGQSRK